MLKSSIFAAISYYSLLFFYALVQEREIFASWIIQLVILTNIVALYATIIEATIDLLNC